jgi:MraZ protein
LFRGRYETTVDAKGRTSLPARFREIVHSTDDPRVVITTALEPCLVVYPYTEWSTFEKKLAERSTFDRNITRIKRLYVSGAVECSLDSHGRVLVPPLLRSYAGITHDVVWSGMVSYIELWDSTRWQEAFSGAQHNAEELAEALAELGI